MNESRFQVQPLDVITLGEVVYLPLDCDGYILGDMGSSYFSYLKGVTVFGKGSKNGYRKYFLGWTEHDVDLPRDVTELDMVYMQQVYSGLQFVPNMDRFKKLITLSSSNRVMRMPEAMRLKDVKAPPSGDALVCSGCKEPVLQASPNMADGSFKCYSCRSNPYR